MTALIGFGVAAFVIAFLAGRSYGWHELADYSSRLRRERAERFQEIDSPRYHRGVPMDVKDGH